MQGVVVTESKYAHKYANTWTYNNLSWLPWFRKANQKYFWNFDWFCLQFNTFFGSLGRECTLRVDQKLSMYVMKLVFNLTK
jgi:hypothetical protein